ncbi:MAG: hypothetical protein WD208_05835 [Dehalococcoidia bacterium]
MARESSNFAQDTSTEEPEEQPVYVIDVKAFEASGRSFPYALYSRLCWRGHCQVCEGQDRKPPVNLGSSTEYLKVISTECSREPDFLLPGTPITEAVFRLLLANGNKPMTLQELQSGLTAAWASVIYLKNLSDEVLRRMLDQQNEYFIVRGTRKK